MKTTKWAVVGPGFIAGRFAQGMLQVPDAQRAAVVSRSEENGKAYAENTVLLPITRISRPCWRKPGPTSFILPRPMTHT